MVKMSVALAPCLSCAWYCRQAAGELVHVGLPRPDRPHLPVVRLAGEGGRTTLHGAQGAIPTKKPHRIL